MSEKIKAIFYAYSSNALDHLAPYAVMCRHKNIPCELIYGEDFIKFKLTPRNNIIKILKDNNITTFNVTNFEKQGILQAIFSFIWFFANIIVNSKLVPIFFKNKTKSLINKIFNYVDGNQLGKNIAKKLIKDNEKVFIFVDAWSKNKKIQNSFLSYIKGKAPIISVGHYPWHFHHTPSITEPSFCEDIVLASNHWEAEAKSFLKKKEITGTLRFSKKWLTILDEYTENKSFDKSEKKNVLILGHTPTHTSDWKRMFDLFMRLSERKDINLSIVPHTRGMSNMEPPSKLKNIWDKTSSLDVAVKKSDIVLFWVSSGIFEAVLRNKKVFYLSFLSKIDGEFIWQEEASSNIIIKNEIELFNALDNYDKNQIIENQCFEKIIWPKGDPWTNVSNFLNKIFNLN